MLFSSFCSPRRQGRAFPILDKDIFLRRCIRSIRRPHIKYHTCPIRLRHGGLVRVVKEAEEGAAGMVGAEDVGGNA